MNLDHDLKRAFRRERPAPGFAERVMQRIEADRAPRVRPVWWRAAAASIALTALLGGWAAHHAAEQRRAEEAQAAEQVLLALRVASQKVRYAQQEVRNIGSHTNR